MKLISLLPDAFGGRGGIALYNRDLLTALCEHDSCNEVVAIPRLVPDEIVELPKKLTYITDGIGGKVKYIKTIFSHLLKSESYDAIICGHINLLPIAYLASRWKRAPLILMIYGIDAWKKPGSLFTAWSIDKVDMVVSISAVTRERFVSWSGFPEDRISLLPNAIHTVNYGVEEKSRSYEERYGVLDKKVLMTLGRMSADEQYKGFDQVLDVLPSLIEKLPNIVYMAVGDGDDYDRLKQKSRDLGVENNVIFTGYINEKDKADVFRLADTYVMPSNGEGFGFVVLEALACGIPVIASNTDGTKEAVRSGLLGMVVDPFDPQELENAILESLSKEKGIPEGLEYFSFENFSQRISSIVNRVIG